MLSIADAQPSTRLAEGGAASSSLSGKKRNIDGENNMKVMTSGRTDLNDYFKLSGIRELKKLAHTPFLVFIVAGDTVEVRIIDNAKNLLEYADEIQVMGQWEGQYRSDFFQFQVRDFRRYVTENPPEKHHIV